MAGTTENYWSDLRAATVSAPKHLRVAALAYVEAIVAAEQACSEAFVRVDGLLDTSCKRSTIVTVELSANKSYLARTKAAIADYLTARRPRASRQDSPLQQAAQAYWSALEAALGTYETALNQAAAGANFVADFREAQSQKDIAFSEATAIYRKARRTAAPRDPFFAALDAARDKYA